MSKTKKIRIVSQKYYDNEGLMLLSFDSNGHNASVSIGIKNEDAIEAKFHKNDLKYDDLAEYIWGVVLETNPRPDITREFYLASFARFKETVCPTKHSNTSQTPQ